MEVNRNLLSDLPRDALINAVAYLSTRDALRLSSLNSTFRRILSFSMLQDPVPLLQSNNWNGTHDEESNTPRRAVWIPVKFRHKTHSVVLRCQWRDQGFGNQKGALFVVAVPASDDPNEQTLESIENGTIVYESPLAPHQQESFQFSFAHSPEKAYYLWYRVGGGGGHRLLVHNLSMRTLVYDDADKWIGRNYKTLCSNGFVENHNAFSLDMLLSIATVPEASRRHFSGFLEQNGFDTSTASLEALEEVAVALQESEQIKVTHDALPPPRTNSRPGVGRVRLFHQVDPDLDEMLQAIGRAQMAGLEEIQGREQMIDLQENEGAFPGDFLGGIEVDLMGMVRDVHNDMLEMDDDNDDSDEDGSVDNDNMDEE
jgi:hypothetical protein